jgi:hypothetical protein
VSAEYADGEQSARRLISKYPAFAKHALKLARQQIAERLPESYKGNRRFGLGPRDYDRVRGFADTLDRHLSAEYAPQKRKRR